MGLGSGRGHGKKATSGRRACHPHPARQILRWTTDRRGGGARMTGTVAGATVRA
jgi:hypothetical protein